MLFGQQGVQVRKQNFAPFLDFLEGFCCGGEGQFIYCSLQAIS